jgi:hypothetical protein
MTGVKSQHRALLALALAAALLLPAQALAYPTMIRHGYSSCAACHVDPTGSGLLTEYGRAQFDVLARWKPGAKKEDDSGEPSPTYGFLWGAASLPDWLSISANLRGGALYVTGQPVRPLIMATDLRAAVTFTNFVAMGSLGYGARAVQLVQLTKGVQTGAGLSNQLVAREFWVALKFLDDALWIRAGRMNLPFGVRNIEHTSWVRSATVTDMNVHQQYGLSVVYSSDKLRGELMGIAGNFSINPDRARERGYSGFIEYALSAKATLGLSSLVTFVTLDPATTKRQSRQAHGLFSKFSPVEPLALMAELDVLVTQPEFEDAHVGYTAFLQADFEPWQGVHFVGTLEALNRGPAYRGSSYGAWLSIIWMALPHTELRLDNVVRTEAGATDAARSASLQVLLQAHVYL